MYSKTQGGRWKVKTYYYFTFDQVKPTEINSTISSQEVKLYGGMTFEEIKAKYDFYDLPNELRNLLTTEQICSLV